MTEFLELTVDKFTFRVAADRLYRAEGLWVLPLDGRRRVRVGMTDYFQQRSGDAAFVTVKPAGTPLAVGDDLADLESIKVTTTLASPVSGAIAAVNEALELRPELVNQSPYDAGWLAEIDTTEWETAQAALLDARSYFDVMETQAREELEKP
jgi:glycine cleavage system H protein